MTEERADYKNWVPNGMIAALGAGTAVLTAGAVVSGHGGRSVLSGLCTAGALASGAGTLWCAAAHRAFSYDGTRQVSRRIVEGVAGYVRLPAGGRGLDVGCGSGALTIACAKRSPQGRMLGMDRWGPEYASFSQALCERNARAEGVGNVAFERGDAVRLSYPDESFDAVTSNYVYHNIPCRDRKTLLRETLRVLKKGGVFAVHDLMGPARYGDMEAFVEELRRQGYAEVRLIGTADGTFLSPREARWLGLWDSMLLTGIK